MKRFGWVAMALTAALHGRVATGDAPPAGPVTPGDFVRDTLGFAVAYQGEVTTLSVNLATALPGDSVQFRVIGQTRAQYEMAATRGVIRSDGGNGWWWRSPDTQGVSRLMIRGPAADSMIFNAFTMTPAPRASDGSLNGYRIGTYPDRPLRGLSIYQRPVGFIEVTEANQKTLVSPHFRLGEFAAKQGGGFPRYVVLDERLLLKLEFLLRRVQDAGYDVETFVIMSGYRTSYYNRTLGNVRYSRHVYGAAADIFVDQRPRDGVMDDLNGNGTIDVGDAQVLVDLINDQLDDPAYAGFIGGAGRYAPNARRGPFVHVDVRDRVARW